jgi:hypothetical protein
LNNEYGLKMKERIVKLVLLEEGGTHGKGRVKGGNKGG